MKMFRIDCRNRKSLMEGYDIFINNRDRDNIFSQNYMFSVSRNAIKQTMHLFDIRISKIQNGRYEITKVIIYSLIIEIETGLFHQTICFPYQGMQ